jgi:trimeric autotransporter adhesin
MTRYIRLPAALAAAAAAIMAGSSRPAYRIETVAGSSNLGDGGPALSAQIGAIQGIAVDRLGNVYLSDTDHHRVRKVQANGIIVTVAGTGEAGFSGDGGAGSSAQLNLPYGLTADAAGNLYIADLGNNRVRRVATDGTIATLAGTGVKGSAGDGGAANAAQLMAPRNLVTDASGNLYVSEFDGHRVRKISLDGKISTVAGIGTAGLRGDGGSAATAQFNHPAGLALDLGGALYVADSSNNRIRKFTPGGTIATVLGASGGITTPRAVAVDGSNTVYVADASSTVVYGYTTSGRKTQLGGGTATDANGDGGPASKAVLSNVLDVAADFAGNVYLADYQRVRKVDATGIIRTLAGDGYQRSVGDFGKATDAVLFRPSAVALDSAGNLLIADTGIGRLRLVAPGGTIVTAAGGFNSPMGVTTDPQGYIYVADTYSHYIRKLGPDRIPVTAVGTGEAGTGPEYMPPAETQLSAPRGVCASRSGTLFVADTANHRVLRAAPAALVESAAGNGSPGDAGDGGEARSAQLNQPSACATDSFGNLFIADTMSHRIRKVARNGTISTVAGNGTAGASGDEGPATDARLNAPRGVAVDDSGDIFIADTGNSRIRMVTSDGAIHTIAGGATAGFKGDGGAAEAALLDSPAGVILDGAGAVYIADTNNNRVRRLTPGQADTADPVVASGMTVVNAASMKDGPVAPGETVILRGTGFGPDAGAAAVYDANSMLPTVLGGCEARFDGASAPLFYVQSGEVHAQVPYPVKDKTRVEVVCGGKPGGSLDAVVAASAPGLYPVAVNPDGSPNGSAKPAVRGSVITLYGTGEGLTDGPNVAGQAAQAPYPHPKLPVKATVGGVAADVVDAFSTPGVAGMLQVNVRVPGGTVPSGTTASGTSPPATIPAGPAAVSISIGGVASQEFTIHVK